MSYGQNGTNGYTNGYHNPEQPSRYDEDPRDTRPGSGRRVRRAGGYGGFFNADLAEHPEPEQPPRPESPDLYNPPSVPAWRRRDESGSRERSRPNVDGARLYGEGPGARQIEGVVQHIQEKWSIMTKPDCIPVHVALQLLDKSSLGRGNEYDDFRETSKALQKALKAIVNEHHQGFNSSIGTFHKIKSSIQMSQSRVRTLKASLLNAKSNLTVAKPELKGLATASQNYDEMLQVFGQIEKIQLLPDQLDARISDKHFLSAVGVLQEALRLIRNSSLENIGALADLRVYLINQEQSLTDILIEELHDHLYLKSPYCQGRWKAFTPTASDVADPREGVASLGVGMQPLYQFLMNLNTRLPLSDDVSRNPESNSFEYIYMIIEALNKLGRLDMAVDRMEQRLPIELFAVVERTNHEVDLRHPAHLRSSDTFDSENLYLNLQRNRGQRDVLHDLLWTLYSKFEAVAEGHRAVHDVIGGIAQREGFSQGKALSGGFRELWKLYQSEIRSLLHDYLATDGNPLRGVGNVSTTSANVFQKIQRDKSKRVFKLTETDQTSTEMVVEQEDLDKILQASVPGLVSKSQRRSGGVQGDRRITYDGPAVGHKLLIEPSVFNISLLLPPSISFLQSLKDIVPSDSDIAISTLTSFLDDFLVNVFNPQLEDTVTELCAQSFIELDAFRQDPNWAELAKRPIFKGTSVFYSLIIAFCKIFDAIPEDQAFAQLIITQLATYHDKCCAWYRALVSRLQSEGETRLKTAAAIVSSGDLGIVVWTLWQGNDLSERERLKQKEVELLTTQTKETPLEPFDIISDRRSVAALCLLYSSMQWLVSRLSQLRQVTEEKPASTQDSRKGDQGRRWSVVATSNLSDSNQPMRLPMTRESAIAFDGIISAYRELATKALLTLHVDIRCGIIHMISRTLKAHYMLDQPANEPDPSVLRLNADLLSFDDTLTIHLPEKEYNFIISGLGLLLDHLLITNASTISVMNSHGCGQMQLNVLVLQQNLKSIENDVMLTRSALFYEYFIEGASAIVSKVKEAGGKDVGFNLEELKVLVELCYSEALQSQQRDIAMQAKRALNDHQLELSECMWNT